MSQFTKTDEAILDKGFVFKNEEKYTEVLEIFLSLKPKYSDSAVLNGTIASCYFGLEQYTKAELYFKKTTVLNSKSEVASRGLFHSLWSQGKFKKALEELDRFLSENDPAETSYKITIEKLYINKENEPDYSLKIIHKYHNKYFKNAN